MLDAMLIDNDVQDEKRSVYQARIWEIFGFGTQYAWLLAVLFCGVLLDGGSNAYHALNARIAILCGLVAGNAVVYLLRSRLLFGRRRTAVVLSAGFVQAAGTLMLAASAINPDLAAPAQVAGGLLAGVSSSLHMIYGNVLWSAIRPERVMLHMGTSAACSAAACIPVILLPAEPRTAVLCLLPIVGGFILANTKRTRPRVKTFRRVNPLVKGMVPRTLAFVATFALCMGALIGSVGIQATPEFQPAVVAGALAAGLAALMLAMRLAPATMLKSLFGIGGPTMVVGCSFIVAGSQGLLQAGTAAGCALIAGGFIACDLFMWFLNAEMVSRTEKSPAEVLARSCLVEWAFMAYGVVLSVSFDAVAGMSSTLVFHAALCFLVVVLAFVFTAHHAGILADARVKGGLPSGGQACALVAERYGLSRREGEVLAYLAAGRSVPYIQDALTLSQSTVKTHVRNIYRKANVTNRQELIDLIAKAGRS